MNKSHNVMHRTHFLKSVKTQRQTVLNQSSLKLAMPKSSLSSWLSLGMGAVLSQSMIPSGVGQMMAVSSTEVVKIRLLGKRLQISDKWKMLLIMCFPLFDAYGESVGKGLR